MGAPPTGASNHATLPVPALLLLKRIQLLTFSLLEV